MKPLLLRKILTLSRTNLRKWGLTGIGGRHLRKLAIGLVCLAAALLAGCAAKDPSLARVEGAEPQRLSFGQPAAVKAAFAGKMQACWFSGTLPLLGGYQYDGKPGVIDVASVQAEVEQITISSGKGEGAHVFIVQFSPFNDNTLISTRTINMPPDLVARLKRDVETWIFGRDDCGGSYGHSATTAAVYTPPAAGDTAPQQTARLQSPSPDLADTAAAANMGSVNRATLSRGAN